MARTEAEYAAAAEKLERFLDAEDPNTIEWQDTSHLAAIGQALDGIDAAEAQLRAAVLAARAMGESWNRIAIPLGVSRQAARQRFAELETGTT